MQKKSKCESTYIATLIGTPTYSQKLQASTLKLIIQKDFFTG